MAFRGRVIGRGRGRGRGGHRGRGWIVHAPVGPIAPAPPMGGGGGGLGIPHHIVAGAVPLTAYQHRMNRQIETAHEFKRRLKQRKLEMQFQSVRDPFQSQALQMRIKQLTSTMGDWNSDTPIVNVLPKDTFEYTNTKKPVDSWNEVAQPNLSFLARNNILYGNTPITGSILGTDMPEYDKETNPNVVHQPSNHFFKI